MMSRRSISIFRLCFLLSVLPWTSLSAIGGEPSASVTAMDELSFFRALINNSVSHIMLTKNIKLQPEFWGNTWAAVNVTRNLTLEGTNPDWASFIQLDLSFIQSKVLLSEGVVLTLQRLELLNVFSRIQRSYDFFAASPTSSTIAWVEVVDHLLLCMPLDFAVAAWRGSPRPAENLGHQNLSLITDKPYCSRTASRCFSPYFYTYDLITSGTQGYNLVWKDVSTICDGFATQACLDNLGADMCYATSLQALLGQRRQQQQETNPKGGLGAQDHAQAKAEAGMIAGCVIAGVAIVVAAVAWLLVSRYRRRWKGRRRGNEGAGGSEPKGAVEDGAKGLGGEDQGARIAESPDGDTLTCATYFAVEAGSALESVERYPRERKAPCFESASNVIPHMRLADVPRHRPILALTTGGALVSTTSTTTTTGAQNVAASLKCSGGGASGYLGGQHRFGRRSTEASCPGITHGGGGGGGGGERVNDSEQPQPSIHVRRGSNSSSSICSLSSLRAAIFMRFRSLVPGRHSTASNNSSSGSDTMAIRQINPTSKAAAMAASDTCTTQIQVQIWTGSMPGSAGGAAGGGGPHASSRSPKSSCPGARDLHHTGSFKLTQRNGSDNGTPHALITSNVPVTPSPSAASSAITAGGCGSGATLEPAASNNRFAAAVASTSALIAAAAGGGSSRDGSLLLVQEVLRGATAMSGGGATAAAAREEARFDVAVGGRLFVGAETAVDSHRRPRQNAGSGLAAAQDVLLGQPLGAGSFGKVYRGLWRGETVAVKVISHDRHNSLESIENELRLSLGFDHPNVVRALSYITCSVDEDGKPTLSMLARDALGGTQWAGRSTISTLGCTDGTLEGAPRDMLAVLYDGSGAAQSQRRCIAETWVIQEFMDRGTLSSLIRKGGLLLPSASANMRRCLTAAPSTAGPSSSAALCGALPRAPQPQVHSAPPIPPPCPAAVGTDVGRGQQQQPAWLQQPASQLQPQKQQPQPQPQKQHHGEVQSRLEEKQRATALQPLGSTGSLQSPRHPSHLLPHLQSSDKYHPQLASMTPPPPPPRPALDLRRVLQCALDVARGLQYLHGRNVCHGDLKPGNILLLEDPNSPWGLVAKLADFGLSRALASDNTHTITENHGTAFYMAPEVLGVGKVSTASCIYSYGIILWELVSGRPPYSGMLAGQVIKGVLLEELRPDFDALYPPPPPGPPLEAPAVGQATEEGRGTDGCCAADCRPLLPAWYPDLARRCWHKDSETRPTATQIVHELEARLLELT